MSFAGCPTGNSARHVVRRAYMPTPRSKLVGGARRGPGGAGRKAHVGDHPRIPSLEGELDKSTIDGERRPDGLILSRDAEQEMNPSNGSLGTLGCPFDRRSPFFIGLTGAFGVGVAYVILRGIADIVSVLVDRGPRPVHCHRSEPDHRSYSSARSLSRGAAVAVVTFGFVLVVGGLRASWPSPRSPTIPCTRDQLSPLQGRSHRRKGMGGQAGVKFHLTGYLNGRRR